MKNNNNIDGNDIPLGLGMAFAQNTEAMAYFSSLSKEQQQTVVNRAHSIRSKNEMQSFVNDLGAKF